MGSSFRKIQKNAERYKIDELYRTMTPDDYKKGIELAIKKTEEKLMRDYNGELQRMGNEYNHAIQEGTLIAMDTLAVEILYELGNVLECYKEDPEYLDQKVEIVQNIYETAMNSIESYASDKYKNDRRAQKEFERKKKTVKKIFGIYGGAK